MSEKIVELEHKSVAYQHEKELKELELEKGRIKIQEMAGSEGEFQHKRHQTLC